MIFATLIFAISCQDASFVVGDCVQKPDSMVVWEITKLENNKIMMEQNQNPQMEQVKESTTGDGWIKTQCL